MASSLPSGLNANAVTRSPKMLGSFVLPIVRSSFHAGDGFHKTVAPATAEDRMPALLNATAETGPACPAYVSTGAPVSLIQVRTRPLSPALASSLPSAE